MKTHIFQSKLRAFWKHAAVGALCVLLSTPLFAQTKGWQVQLLGGVFTPLRGELENVYGNTPALQLALRAPLGENGRLKIGASYYGASGDPYYFARDFNAGDNTGQFRMAAIDLGVELTSAKMTNPRIYLGAGISYYYGAHEIKNLEKYTGQGLGAVFTLAPEFRVNDRVSIMLEPALRLGDLRLRGDTERFRFDVTGASISLGASYDLSGI